MTELKGCCEACTTWENTPINRGLGCKNTTCPCHVPVSDKITRDALNKFTQESMERNDKILEKHLNGTPVSEPQVGFLRQYLNESPDWKGKPFTDEDLLRFIRIAKAPTPPPTDLNDVAIAMVDEVATAFRKITPPLTETRKYYSKIDGNVFTLYDIETNKKVGWFDGIWHTPTVEPTEKPQTTGDGVPLTMENVTKMAKEILGTPTETVEVEKWAEESTRAFFSQWLKGEDLEAAIGWCESLLITQKEEARKEVLRELEEVIRLMFIDSASTDEEVWRNKTIYEALTIIKNLKGGRMI